MNITKYLWMSAGFLLLVLAYIGVVMPGIPFSIPLVGAAYCFSKSSDRMHNWLYNHKHFGPFLTNFAEKRIFPTRAKYLMLFMMASCLVIMWFATGNLKAMAWAAVFMAGGAAWAWRLPGSEEEWERRNSDK
jgi:uncharacterized membrane protein YbaN (DUF454 family)